MSDTELTVSHSLVVKVDPKAFDFNGLVQAIVAQANRACGELLGQMLRAMERNGPGTSAGPVGQSRPANQAIAAAVGGGGGSANAGAGSADNWNQSAFG